VSWSAGDLGGEGQAIRSALSTCKRKHGAGKLTLTMYVDADGNVMAADAAVDEGEAADAVGCAIDAAKGKTFPSPGSFPAKVSLEV
jgi:hypothetical protein